VTFAFTRRPSFWLTALPIAGLLGTSVFGGGGLCELWRLHHERATLRDEVFRLLQENDALRQRIVLLRHSDRDLERLARQELGLVRDGEIVYRFRPPEDKSNPGTR
jgi:cell division protein FtsB